MEITTTNSKAFVTDDMNTDDEEITAENGKDRDYKLDDRGSKRKDELKLTAFLRTVRTDPVYRHRLIHTIVVCWSFVALGWVAGMTGPVFPDLRLIIGEGLGVSSWLFTSGSFGYLTGSLIGGLLYDKLNKVLLLTASTLLLAVCTVLTPYCSSLVLMLAIRFAVCFFSGCLDTGGNADILYVWGSQSGPYMQAVHFGFSLGALISPLAVAPFLAKKVIKCDNHMDSSNISVTYNQINGSMSTASIARTKNDISEANVNTSYLLNNSTNNASLLENCFEVYEETSVHYAFLLSSILTLTSTAGFLYVFFRLRFSNTTSKADVKNASKSDRSGDAFNRHRMSRKLKVIFLMLLAALIGGYCVVEDGVASFLMTFALDYLGWDKSTGALATASFWIAFAVGRFFGIFTVSCCNSTTMLNVYLTLLSIGYVGLLIGTELLSYPLIWIFIPTLGFSMSVIFPAIFSWTSDHIINVSGKISALFLTSASLTGMSVPLLIGNLMDRFHPMWLVYTLVIVMFMNVALYIMIRVLEKCFVDKGNAADKDIQGDQKETMETELKLLS